ncbi:MAG: hypothetical protein Q9160_005763 [Pyrenula sp. 1 TL-2023]
MPRLEMIFFLLAIPPLQDFSVYAGPSSQDDPTKLLTTFLDASLNEVEFSSYGTDSGNELGPSKNDDLSPKSTKLIKTVEEMFRTTRRDEKDNHLAHLPLLKPDGSTFDLQIDKNTICNSAKFRVGIVPGQAPKTTWRLVINKTYGQIAGAMQGSSQQDIGKASKSLVNAVLRMGKPMFGHISGDSSCKAVFPAPQRRDLLHFPHSSVRRDRIDQLLEAARSYVLRYVEDGRILYIGGVAGAWFNVLETMRHGGFVFMGGAQQANPQATAARTRVHSWVATIALYTVIEQFQKAMRWETVSRVVSMKLIHPMVNALFDGLQKIWSEIKPQKDGDDGNAKRQERNDPSACVNVNDFKFVIQNIGPISKQDVAQAKAQEPQSCPAPDLQ